MAQGRRRHGEHYWANAGLAALGVIVAVLVVAAFTRTVEEPANAGEPLGYDPTAELTPWERAMADAWADGTMNLGIVGDSITAGWFADSESTTYRELVRSAEYPGTLNLEWVATPGATSGEMADQAQPVIDASEVVVVETGTNDTRDQKDLSILREEYPELLGMVPDGKPLLCLGAWRRSQVIDDEMARMCGEAGGTFVSLRDLRELVGPAGSPAWPDERDDFHPNQEGHTAIADRVIATIVP